jgi:hypothetical protein
MAGRNDSGNVAESGTDQALKENALSAAAGQLASTEEGITEANYATGRQNFQSAVGEEEGVASAYAPNATAGNAISAGNSAFGAATQIQQEEGQEAADIAGGITSLAGGVAGGIGNLDTTGSSSGLEQARNFLEGFF